ncbi:PTS transporter subunit IIC [Alkalicoccus urumqiensis]|uniref:PTS sugar transporter subunit IIC n=1 Tax=Alkalicoccus urumqiensis TaxID=1548213 RepID=A0A2P6MGI2_ALKUR|nr:PTS sugar transporter subunit IIC [Alkalicoccus urumqiensis]PRO65398.1 PTS sugar transporter subunit IIC [Alkalicoccus urumqiensis]
MKDWMKRKGVEPGFRLYFIHSLSYMALGLFASLIIGLIIQTAGETMEGAGIEAAWLTGTGAAVIALTGPAIGAATAYSLQAPRLVLFASLAAGAVGYEAGGPAGSFLAAIIAVEAGKLISGETKLDIILTPLAVIMTGAVTAAAAGPPLQAFVTSVGRFVMWSAEQQPLLLGILIAITMGLALTAPISSAAIAVILGLEGVAAGAATAGCCAQMVGFAVSSYRENKGAGLAALGIGTSMLQIANVVKNPRILIPPTAAGAVTGALAAAVFAMENNPEGAGMGTSGFVGQIMTFRTMGFSLDVWTAVLLLHFIVPALLSFLLSEWMRKKEWIRFGDMKIEQS